MRKEKQLLLNEMKEKIDASTAMLVTRYSKLEPNVSWKLRDLLGKSGNLFEVVQKRVFLKATEQSGIALDESKLEGHIGVVFITKDDAIKSAKAVLKFSEDHEGIMTVLYGQIEGKIIPGTEVEALSKLPGLDEMRAIMIGLFTSPMSQMLSVMEAAMAGPLAGAKEELKS